ncbi:MAG: hypothetical protein PWQ17_1432 [Anaerophaga sp.]|uniref:hypothetical protein n=1 Tax=Anaerophaga thermohalophila TaxID=177400 RepID=UPI000237D597|nr:hypothetical protein [Anaerophaga thermohalophila]MDK2841927.1 hypothetical protein [Anaerophaga sp.]MDN5292455.1 hypothetical protein [Anaerophaga sp.]
MKNFKLSFILLILTAVMLSSCSQRIFDFTMVSTKNIDLSKASTFKRSNNRANGEDGVYWIITIPLGVPNLKEAIDKAIESTPGAVALVDGVVYSKSWWAIVTGYSGYVVEGTPLIDPALAFNSKDIPTYGKIELDKNGEIKNVENISSTEYLALKNKLVKDSKETKFKNSLKLQ